MAKRFWVNVSVTIQVDEEDAAYEALNNMRAMVKEVGGSVDRCSVFRNEAAGKEIVSPATLEAVGPGPMPDPKPPSVGEIAKKLRDASEKSPWIVNGRRMSEPLDSNLLLHAATALELVAAKDARIAELSDAVTDLELTAERSKLTRLRLRAVVLAAREFAPVGNPTTFNQYERELIAALKDLDAHDEHHGVSIHLDEARRRGLPVYAALGEEGHGT